MEGNQWTLIFFTIIVQGCAGVLCTSKLIPLFANASEKNGVVEIGNKTAYFLVPFLMAGTVISLLHLGTPANCVNAIRNIATSWLSREIFFNSAFTGLVCLLALMEYKKIGSAPLRGFLGWIAALTCIILVFIMINVYLIRTVPSWNSFFTWVQFFSTTFLLGVLFFGAAYTIFLPKYLPQKQKKPGFSLLPLLAAIAILLLGIELTGIFLQVSTGAAKGGTVLSSVTALTEDHPGLLFLRLAFMLAALVILSYFLFYKRMAEKMKTDRASMMVIALLLVLAAELAGRFLFYASYARVGLLN